MTSIRAEFIATKFNEWLDRFSPPRLIANNFDAQQRDANSLLGIVTRYAPKDGYSEWLEGVLRRIEEGMTTRSWPAPGEVTKACKAGGNTAQAPSEAVEDAAIARMIEWHDKFKSQMPGHGRPDRTAELIRRGILSNEREARFHGYDLSDDQFRRALDQKQSKAEWRHHISVTARIRGVSEYEAEAQIRAEYTGPMNRDAATIPDKTSKPNVAKGDAA